MFRSTHARRRPTFAAAVFTALAAVGLAIPPDCQAGPAPPLTQVYVYAVRSTAFPDWEYFSPGAVATRNPDRGTALQVAVAELGYSSWRQAQFNGANMRLVQSVPVYNPYPYVVGYIQVFQYDGYFTGGTFTYQSRSMVAPIRTLSTRFVIN